MSSEGSYRINTISLITEALMNFNLIASLPKERINSTAKIIERSIQKAAIDKCNGRNIAAYWENDGFLEIYSNIIYQVVMNLDINSSVLRSHIPRIRECLVRKIYKLM